MLWQPFYTAWIVCVFLLFLLLATPIVALLAIGNNQQARKNIWWVLHFWSSLFVRITGMPLQRIGTLPDEGRYVVVANHVSYLDTIVIFPAIPGYFRPLGKKEISKIPVFGFIYKQIVLMVDRESQQSRALSMKLMSKTLRNECSVVVFPEGTFNESEEPMGAFFDGAFRLAIAAQQPILPILFPDTVDRWHYSHWWKFSPGRNRAFYMPPISTEGLTAADVPQLKERVRTMMGEELVKLRS